MSRAFRIELEFGSVGFCEKGKTGEPEKNVSEQGENQQSTLHTYDAESGIPGPHWWEARALTIAPPTDFVADQRTDCYHKHSSSKL